MFKCSNMEILSGHRKNGQTPYRQYHHEHQSSVTTSINHPGYSLKLNQTICDLMCITWSSAGFWIAHTYAIRVTSLNPSLTSVHLLLKSSPCLLPHIFTGFSHSIICKSEKDQHSVSSVLNVESPLHLPSLYLLTSTSFQQSNTSVLT